MRPTQLSFLTWVVITQTNGFNRHAASAMSLRAAPQGDPSIKRDRRHVAEGRFALRTGPHRVPLNL
jgi:hypothetical protein